MLETLQIVQVQLRRIKPVTFHCDGFEPQILSNRLTSSVCSD